MAVERRPQAQRSDAELDCEESTLQVERNWQAEETATRHPPLRLHSMCTQHGAEPPKHLGAGLLPVRPVVPHGGEKAGRFAPTRPKPIHRLRRFPSGLHVPPRRRIAPEGARARRGRQLPGNHAGRPLSSQDPFRVLAGAVRSPDRDRLEVGEGVQV